LAVEVPMTAVPENMVTVLFPTAVPSKVSVSSSTEYETIDGALTALGTCISIRALLAMEFAWICSKSRCC
jgi:hypothetical protein